VSNFLKNLGVAAADSSYNRAKQQAVSRSLNKNNRFNVILKPINKPGGVIKGVCVLAISFPLIY
jgi:hypothetical protein